MKNILFLATFSQIAMAKSEIQNLEDLLQDPSCNRECVGYCLNYFPHHTIMAKCGCLGHRSALESAEKFFERPTNLLLTNSAQSGNMVDPIIEQYKNKILDIDTQIISSKEDVGIVKLANSNGPIAAQTSESTELEEDKSNTRDEEQSQRPRPHKPTSDDICKTNDKSCLEKESSCLGTCDQKCKTEQKDKQKACINLCINQCMASFGIKPANHFKILSSPDESPISLAAISGHAQVLQSQGDWCPPSCTAQCGQIVLMGSGPEVHNDIVTCFKDRCQCKIPHTDMIDKDLYTKFQADMRIEHLILEKEVRGIINQFQDSKTNLQSLNESTEAAASMVYVDLGDTRSHNQLLEDIVLNSLKEGEAYLSDYSVLMMVWAGFMLLSLCLMTVAVMLLFKSSKQQKSVVDDSSSQEDEEVCFDDQWGNGPGQKKRGYLVACTQKETAEKQERLDDLSEKLLQ